MSDEKTGRTTRLVDEYVQKYFTEPMFTPIVVKDHVDDYEHNVDLLDRLRKRLEREFGETPYFDDKAVMYVNPYQARFGYTSDAEHTYCVIIRVKDRVQEARNQNFKLYVDRVIDLKNEYKDNEKEIIKRKPPLVETLLVNRANGQSTRLVDEYVQKYFSLKPGEYIEVIDHYGGEGEMRAHDSVARKVCCRLKEEHGEKFYYHRGTYPRIVKVEK